ncbi:MAG: hypothetical protein WCE51_10490 [Chthoniobacterales bacterium]
MRGRLTITTAFQILWPNEKRGKGDSTDEPAAAPVSRRNVAGLFRRHSSYVARRTVRAT